MCINAYGAAEIMLIRKWIGATKELAGSYGRICKAKTVSRVNKDDQQELFRGPGIVLSIIEI